MTEPVRTKILVVIPTYNEAENIEALIKEIFQLSVPGLGILVVDDQSPDGTSEIVGNLIPNCPHLSIVRREGPAGRGLAGREGFLYALKSRADYVIEMDGDFSHQPKHIPELLKGMADCDIAVGSRLVVGGSDADRPGWRQWLTQAANVYARGLLGIPIRDANSGFRCFSREALLKINPETLKSRGPSIVHEVLYRAIRQNLRFREVPIEFVDRKRGSSKLNLLRLLSGYFWILRLKFSS